MPQILANAVNQLPFSEGQLLNMYVPATTASLPQTCSPLLRLTIQQAFQGNWNESGVRQLMLCDSETQACIPDPCLALAKTRCRIWRMKLHSKPLLKFFQLQSLYRWVVQKKKKIYRWVVQWSLQRDIYTRFSKVIRAHIKYVHLNQFLGQNNEVHFVF